MKTFIVKDYLDIVQESVAHDDDSLLKISRGETGPPVLCQQSTDRKCSLRCSAGGGTHMISGYWKFTSKYHNIQ